MRTSPISEVRDLYDTSAHAYARMMDSEIDLPVYLDILSRLAERIAAVRGPVMDTSCGPGHVLSRFRERFDPRRILIGVDLSPRMVALSSARLGAGAEVVTGDMRDLKGTAGMSLAAVLSFFAIHHLDPEEILPTLQEWWRVLRPGGQLVVAAWEGTGPIDYGGESSVVALRYTDRELAEWAQAGGFVVDRCVVEPVEDMPMHAVYLEATRK